MKKIVALLLPAVAALCGLAALPAKAEISEMRVPLGAGGFGFLPLHIMKHYGLIEKKAAEAGLKLTVNWSNVGGPAVMNDALLSGSADFISAGPPAFLVLWDKTKGNAGGKAKRSPRAAKGPAKGKAKPKTAAKKRAKAS